MFKKMDRTTKILKKERGSHKAVASSEGQYDFPSPLLPAWVPTVPFPIPRAPAESYFRRPTLTYCRRLPPDTSPSICQGSPCPRLGNGVGPTAALLLFPIVFIPYLLQLCRCYPRPCAPVPRSPQQNPLCHRGQAQGSAVHSVSLQTCCKPALNTLFQGKKLFLLCCTERSNLLCIRRAFNIGEFMFFFCLKS